MNWTWGDFWQRSRKWLKVSWLIAAGLVAVYIGAVEPMQLRRQQDVSKATGLGAVAGGSLMPEQQGLFHGSANGMGAPNEDRVAVSGMLASAAPDADKSESDEDRKLVRTGSMDLVVKDPGAAAEQIRQLAEHAGGFLLNSQVSGAQESASASVTIRVPVAHFEEVRAGIRKLALRVESDHIEAQDVTRDYVDREARLRNLRAQEQQYLAILKRATTVKDTLEVSDKLNEVRSSIETQQAEFAALAKQVETVAITVSLRSEVEAQVLGLHWRPLYRLKLALRDGLDGLGDYLAAMASFLFYLPTILLWMVTLVAGAALAWRVLRWGARVFFAFPKSATAGKGVR